MGAIFDFFAGVVETVVGVVTGNPFLIVSGISTVVGSFSSGPKKEQPKPGSVGGTSEQISYDPAQTRRLGVGLVCTAGSLNDAFTHDHLPWGGGNEGKNRVEEMFINLLDHEVDSLVEVWDGSKKLTLGAYDSTMGWAIPEFNSEGKDHLYIKFYNGAWNQSADAHCVSVGGGYWTSSAKGRWVCYARVTYVASIDSDDQAWAGGKPQLKFVIKGAKLYDPRKDSTVGGSGSHRWGDLTTYEWTDNAAVVQYNLCRGIYRPDGKRFYGVGAPFGKVRFDDAVAAMNACDELVSLKAGGTEKRYRVGGEIDVSYEVRTALQAIEQSMAGRTYNVSGTWRIFAGVAASPVLAITDSDILPREAATYTPKLANDRLVNAIYGTYTDPASGYAAKALPVRRNDDDIADDGGVERKKNLQLDFVQSRTQAQRVMEIARKKARCQISFTRTLPHWAYPAEAGDWISWTSTRYNFTDAWFEISRTAVDGKLNIPLTFTETNAAVYGWTPSTDELPDTGGTLPSADPPIVLGAPTGVVISPGSETGDGGSVAPVIGLQWDPPNTSLINGITFQWRKVGTTTVQSITAIDVNDANATLRNLMLPDVQYEGRLKFNTPAGMAAGWSAWTPFRVTTGFVLNAGADPISTQLQYALSQAKPIRDTVAASTYFPWLDQLEAAIAAATATMADHQNTVGILHDAGIERLGDGTVRIRQVDELTATVNGISASVATVQEVMVDLQGRTSAFWQTTVSADGTFAYARLAADGISSSIMLVADLIGLVSPSDGSLVPALTVQDGSVYIANKIYIGTNLYIDRSVPGLVYNDGVVALCLGGRFGANGDLVFWYGLARDPAEMTKTNAAVWFDTTANAYFGGTLSAGILTTKAATSALGDAAVAETPFFGSNGGPINVVLGYSYTSSSVAHYQGHSYIGTDPVLDDLHNDQIAAGYAAGNSSGTSIATIYLYRSVNHGAYALAAILTITGTWSMTVVHNVGNPGDGIFQSWDLFFSISYSGSLTYTDSGAVAQDRQFKAVINARDPGFWGSSFAGNSQLISIICTEE